MGNGDQRPPLPARLSSAERNFYLELRRLVGAAGLSCRALEESTSARPDFFSKSQWARWINGISAPPRNAIRKLSERLARDEIEAGHLVDLWDQAFAPADFASTSDSRQIRPRQLPVSVQQFIGRASHLHVLSDLVDQVGSSSGPVVIVIEGMAGVGKTTLANHLARSVSDRFPDGQLYVNVRGYDHAVGPMTPGEVLPGFLDALGVAPQSMRVSADDQAALYRSVMAGKRVLIVIDKAYDAEQVRRLLPGGPGSLVLVTSRNQLAGLVAEGAHLLRLDPFTAAEARELLDRRLGPDRVESESQAAEELIRMCAGLPLALSVAVAYAALHPSFRLAVLISEFRDRRLDLLETGDPATTARSVFARSYDHLNDHARLMFRLLGSHPGADLSLAAAASLAAMPPDQARKALDELTRAHLLEEYLPGWFTFHALLHAYAAELTERFDSGQDRRAAEHRMLDHYLHSAMSAARRLVPYRSSPRVTPPLPGVVPVELADRAQARNWFDSEVPVLLALIGYADSSGFDEHAWLIPWALSEFLHHSGRFQHWVATQSVAVTAARRLGDPLAQAHSHYELGHALSRAGDNNAAEPHVRQSLELFRELGDRDHEALLLNGLASMLDQQGRYSEALALALDGLRMVETAGQWWPQSALENTVGWLYAKLERYDLALAHCQRAVGLCREAANRRGMAATLDSVGFIYRQSGDLTKAVDYYQRAIKTYQDYGDPFGQAQSLCELGDALAEAGDTQAARDGWIEAAAILERLAHPLAEQVRARLAALVA